MLDTHVMEFAELYKHSSPAPSQFFSFAPFVIFFFLFTEKYPSYNSIHLLTEFVFAILGDANATLAVHLMPRNIYIETC